MDDQGRLGRSCVQTKCWAGLLGSIKSARAAAALFPRREKRIQDASLQSPLVLARSDDGGDSASRRTGATKVYRSCTRTIDRQHKSRGRCAGMHSQWMPVIARTPAPWHSEESEGERTARNRAKAQRVRRHARWTAVGLQWRNTIRRETREKCVFRADIISNELAAADTVGCRRCKTHTS